MEYRFYSFINMYLSSIQNGIQTAHLISEMMIHANSCKENLVKASMISEWARNDKTIICCNGGPAKSLYDLRSFFDNDENLFPHIHFYEDSDSLDGAITGVGIILPNYIYDTYWDQEENAYIYDCDEENLSCKYREYDGFLFELIKRTKSAKLAI